MPNEISPCPRMPSYPIIFQAQRLASVKLLIAKLANPRSSYHLRTVFRGCADRPRTNHVQVAWSSTGWPWYSGSKAPFHQYPSLTKTRETYKYPLSVRLKRGGCSSLLLSPFPSLSPSDQSVLRIRIANSIDSPTTTYLREWLLLLPHPSSMATPNTAAIPSPSSRRPRTLTSLLYDCQAPLSKKITKKSRYFQMISLLPTVLATPEAKMAPSPRPLRGLESRTQPTCTMARLLLPT